MDRPYELLVRFAKGGAIAGALVRHIRTIDGREFELDPVALENATDPAFVDFAKMFSAQALFEASQLRSQVAILTARIEQLVALLPFDPRAITVDAFLDRLTKRELLWLTTDADQGVAQVAATFNEWDANNWPIHFDSPEFLQAMQYLQSTDRLTAERVAELTRDASRAESPAPAVA